MPTASVKEAQAWLTQNFDVKASHARKGTGMAELRVEQARRALERADIELAEKRGSLVDRKVAEGVLFAEGKRVREALEQWPLRAGPILAEKLSTAQGPLLAALEDEMRRFLTELAAPEFRS
jgi:hypothetical protein